MPLSVEFPQQSTFNLTGGFQIKPEFLSLYLALSFYTASFIAEIVRAGIMGVSKGQTEAAGRARAAGKARSCASSWCRRRCASSSRR